MSSVRILALIFLTVAAAFFGAERYQNYRQNKMMKIAMNGSAEAKNSVGIPLNCNSKKYCITVYVAPWCPACKSSESTFQALNRYLPLNRPEVGFGIIIGAGKNIENEEEKERLSPIEGIADNSGAILKLRKINSFPTWIINDQSGKEVFRQSGGMQITDEGQVRLLLDQFFKI